MCQSVCENFFRSCGYQEELWRCSDLIDKMSTDRGDPVNFLPGSPFKANERNADVCTPSIKGAGSLLRLSKLSLALTMSIVLAVL